MLVVCNGAAKSGSTWLYNIIQNIASFEWPQERFISRSNSKHPTIKEIYLAGYLAGDEYRERNIISKNHYGKPEHRALLTSSDDTRVIGMSRDTRDVIVSSYYDECRRHGYEGSFETFYWETGRLLVDRLHRYHEVWSQPHPQIHTTTYEDLKTSFAGEVRKIGDFLGVPLSDEDISRIEQATSIGSLRESYKDDPQYNTQENAFFRKGVIGDWENHFDDKMLDDYARIDANGLGRYDLVYLRNRLREKAAKLFG